MQSPPSLPPTATSSDCLRIAEEIEKALPEEGLFAGHRWRIGCRPLTLSPKTVRELEMMGRVLLKFNQAVNRLYHQSASGKQPSWIADCLDCGKPSELIEIQRNKAFRKDLPRVIRPDLLLTDNGFRITELDSIPGGIGLTAWLNETYSKFFPQILGGNRGMIEGFRGIFNSKSKVHIQMSEESATYRPEMEWLAKRLNETGDRFVIQNETFEDYQEQDSVYRFFELFDLKNLPGHRKLFQAAELKQIQLTPPPKPLFEEKMLLAFLCNRHLDGFWHRELGDGFYKRIKEWCPYTWLVDPAEIPPHAAIPRLELTDWNQLKSLSQKQRKLILKISGFSERAWGARGLYLGSDLSSAEWSLAVDEALTSFNKNPFVLQEYHTPNRVETTWFDAEEGTVKTMQGRVRLCPYYFVHGEGDQARTKLGGALATICPEDKKIIHGMKDAVMVPCSIGPQE